MLTSTKKLPFSGCCTAMVTPFENGEISLDTFKRMVKAQIDAGVSALVVCGTTGEAPTLTDKEKLMLISCASEISDGRVPVIAGTGSPCTDRMLRLSAEARDAGADALLIVTPYYNKGTESGILKSYFAAAELGPPVILYNVPGRTGVDLAPHTVRKLSSHENIVAIKEAASACRIEALCADELCDLHVYSGNDGGTLQALAVGAKGVISVISNILPAETCELCRAFFSGDVAKSRKLQLCMLPLIKMLFEETSPAPVKYLCGRLGICSEDTRLPLGCISDTLKERLESGLQDFFVKMQKN